MFTVAISSLSTSNLPWFMDLTFQVPVQHCSLQHQTLVIVTSYIHNWVLFLLWLHPFILSGVISQLISNSILGTYWPGVFLFQYPIILPSHTVHGVFKARILKWFAIPFSSGPHSVRPLHDPSVSSGPHRAWLSFIDLDKAVVLWADWLVFCDYGFSVPALWCPLATRTMLLGFLLPWTWCISSWLLQQSTAAAPYLGRGLSQHGCPSWPWTWSSSLGPLALAQPLLLGHGIAPLGRRPWSPTWCTGCYAPCRIVAMRSYLSPCATCSYLNIINILMII